MPIGLNDHIVWFRTEEKTLVATRIDDEGKFVGEADFGPGERRCYGHESFFDEGERDQNCRG